MAAVLQKLILLQHPGAPDKLPETLQSHHPLEGGICVAENLTHTDGICQPLTRIEGGASMTAGQFDPRLVAYFGDPVLQSGFMPLPNLFLRHYTQLGLSNSQAMFLLQLMASAWDLGSPPATLSQVAARMGLTRRGVQLISAELHARGLVTVYDQYDATGRQTENAFDLGPLFARLAAFAPVAAPDGQHRQRRSRPQPQRDDVTASVPTMEDAVPAAITVQQHALRTVKAASFERANPHSPMSANSRSPSPGTGIRTPLESWFAETANSGSQLKKEFKKRTKNVERGDQEQQQQAVAAVERDRPEESKETSKPSAVLGQSLRLGQPLANDMVARSRDVLARIGINADVADGAAPALAPEECWAIWLHARTARLGPAWVATQIYDRHRHQPRLAGIPRRYDAPGRLLAQLLPQAAEALLDYVEQQWPQAVETPWPLEHQPELSLQEDQDVLHAALEAIWKALSADQQQPARNPAPRLPEVSDPRWEAARQRLVALLPPADFQTWIAPLVPIDLTPEFTLLSVPNVFVRDEVQGTFADALAGALRAELGYDAPVEIIIDSALGVRA